MAQEAESYSNVAFQKAWQGRARGLWACAALGLGFGAAIGVAAPFFPVLVGAQTLAAAVSLILPSMAVFGAAGIAGGFAAGQSVGLAAGASSGVAKEQGDRDLARAGNSGQEVDVNRPQPTANELAIQTPSTFSDFVKPKPLAFFAVLGAIGGAVMGAAALILGPAAGAIPGAALLLGSAAASPVAVMALSVGVMASFGALFGTNMPKFTTITQNFVGKALSGDLFENKESTFSSASQPQVQPPQFAPLEPVSAPPAKPGFSYRDLVHSQAQTLQLPLR